MSFEQKPVVNMVVWTRIGSQPVKMGVLEASSTNSSFTYDEAFIELGLPGLGIILAPSIYKRRPIVRESTRSHSFPPPIQSLVPPHSNGKNFQRELIMRMLEKRGIKPTTSFEADWEGMAGSVALIYLPQMRKRLSGTQPPLQRYGMTLILRLPPH